MPHSSNPRAASSDPSLLRAVIFPGFFPLIHSFKNFFYFFSFYPTQGTMPYATRMMKKNEKYEMVPDPKKSKASGL